MSQENFQIYSAPRTTSVDYFWVPVWGELQQFPLQGFTHSHLLHDYPQAAFCWEEWTFQRILEDVEVV